MSNDTRLNRIRTQHNSQFLKMVKTRYESQKAQKRRQAKDRIAMPPPPPRRTRRQRQQVLDNILMPPPPPRRSRRQLNNSPVPQHDDVNNILI